MSQTVSSALGNRVVTFVNNVDNDFDCVICMQVADNPVRCSGLCAGIFCNGCMQQALARNRSCPSCKKATTAALKDVWLRNHIMKHQVYCINKGNADESIKSSNNRKGKVSSDEKCAWTGKYDELATHCNHCGYEMVSCINVGCSVVTTRCKLIDHLRACMHRTEQCEHCGNVMKAANMAKHAHICRSFVVFCQCGFECAKEKLAEHQAIHAHLPISIEPQPSQVQWRITDIASKLRESKFQMKVYESPRFDVLFNGNHKLYIKAEIQGNSLGLYLRKDVANVINKSCLDVGGISFTVKKAGVPEHKGTFALDSSLSPPAWSWGFGSFITDLNPYIDNDTVTINLNLKKESTRNFFELVFKQISSYFSSKCP